MVSSWPSSINRLFNRKSRKAAARRGRRRDAGRGGIHQIESLEARRVMAFDLVAAFAESTTPFYVHTVSASTVELNDAPQQITLRFAPGVKIDPATLGTGISIVRSGGGSDPFGNGNDITVQPAWMQVDDSPNENQVIIRFAETLPDDIYRINVSSSLESVANGPANAATFNLRLDLGAFVVGVVPQPVTRVSGALVQSRNTIDVYFNREDPLNVTSATNRGFYRLIEVNAAGNDVGAPIVPSGVTYDPATGRAVLTFAAEIPVAKTWRLEIGGAGVNNPPIAGVEGSDTNSSFSTARNLGQMYAVELTLSGSINVRPTITTPAGDMGFLTQPGTVDEPGHRNTLADSGQSGLPFATVDPATGIQSINYNFRSDYGIDPQGNPLQNTITETQKQRAREIFELLGLYLGARFVETPTSGITVVTGDMRALDPMISTGPAGLGGVFAFGPAAGQPGAIMDSTENWGSSEYGGAWFQVAMHEIFHTMGLDHTYHLSSIMGQGLTGEPVFPGDYDIVQARQYYPESGSDIDLYKFNLINPGKIVAQTVVGRPGSVVTSQLDTVVSVYREDIVGGRPVRTLVARNDNYYGRDSLVELDVTPGTYYVGVTATGNTAFNPEVSDSGARGRSEGDYALKLAFKPQFNALNTILDQTGKPIDGDRDGQIGGGYKFWFNTASLANTVFVDKAAAVGGTGSLAAPYNTIGAAIANVGARTIIRIVGNAANTPYLVGTNLAGQPLPDGTTFNVPQGVTAMIDAGAVLKFRATNIDVGSSSELVSRAGAAIQVLGTPTSKVTFTSYHDDTIGGNSDGTGPVATGGQWGGLALRADSDAASKKAFVNTVQQSNFRFGGGTVLVDSQLASFAPIQIENTRPTITFNTITGSAGAAMAATPNAFEDTGDRIGPEIRGNTLTGNSINGLFVKIATAPGKPLEQLDVPARFKSTDIVYVLQENLVIAGGAGGYIENGIGQVLARKSGRLQVDPGVVVKLQNARIELDRGISQLIAEGQAANRVVFTSLADHRFGAGGTFDTNGNLPNTPAPGDWGGIIVNAGGAASIDNAYIGFGGGATPIEGIFDFFNVIETHQGDLRVTNSRIENNAAGLAATFRSGRGTNDSATIFVRGAQPIIVGNDFRANAGAVVSVNANSLSNVLRPDVGRSTGVVSRFTQYETNRGPLVAGNRLAYTPGDTPAIAGMVVRGEEITTESVWDDTDIVHVLQNEIIVNNFQTATGLRLQSRTDASLIVKLLGATAGFTASGDPLDITDRIGGTVQVIGQPGYPVVLTSLKDDSVGASLDPLGVTVKDTNVDGTTTSPAPGDWRSVKFLPYANDRNVAVVIESEKAMTGGEGTNDTTVTAQQLGVLAPNYATAGNTTESAQEKSGDEIRRLGFEIHGAVSPDAPSDVDVYRFTGYAGSEVWIDLDKTAPSLDSMIEVLDAAGNVIARSADSTAEGVVVHLEDQVDLVGGTSVTYQLDSGNVTAGTLTGVITDMSGFFPVVIQTFTVNAAGVFSFQNVLGEGRFSEAIAPTFSAVGGALDLASGALTLDYSGLMGATQLTLRYASTNAALGPTRGSALALGKDSYRGNDFYSQNSKDGGLRIVLPGTIGSQQQYFVRVRSQPKYEPVSTAGGNGGVTATSLATYRADLADPAKVAAGATSGTYELRIRLRQHDEKPGSTVRYADIRFPTIGIDAQGLPGRSNLVGEIGENPTDDNGTFDTAQFIGNLLQTDQATISVAGSALDEGDIDWYTFAVDFAKVQSGGGSWATIFDIDYGDGFRGDLTISVFDAQGRLVYIGRDSNVENDQPGVGQGNDFDDLARGSIGQLDPYIGTSRLFAGTAEDTIDPTTGLPTPAATSRYYVAVSSNERLPEALNAYYRADAANSLVRLEPISSLARLIDDTIGPPLVPPTQNAAFNTTNQFTLSTNVTPFTLADVTLFMTSATSLVTVDPMRGVGFGGGLETVIEANYGNGRNIGDIIMRSDGRMYAYAGIGGLANSAGRLELVDTGNGVRTVIGTDNIQNRPAATTITNETPALQGQPNPTTTVYEVANPLAQPSTLTGTVTIAGEVGGNPVSGIWTFVTDVNGVLTFTPGAPGTPGIPVPDPSLPSPATGNFNSGNRRITIVWTAAVDTDDISLTNVGYTFDALPETVTTDTVDALAWRRANPGSYQNLMYSVRDGGSSRLYAANSGTGSAAGAAAFQGYIQDAGNSLGIVTGMAWGNDGLLYGVDTNGWFFTINAGNAVATLISQVPGASFQGLALGPQNLGAGAYANLFFAIDSIGNLRALDTNGALLPVFDQNGDGVAGDQFVSTGFFGATGLAFSPLDVNLWHPTTFRGKEIGHGVNNSLAADGIRPLDIEGGSSMYFGFEQFQAELPTYDGYALVNGQHGAVSPTWHQDLSTNGVHNNSYNLPGGAYGSMQTNPFSLEGYVYGDKPTLYFNYWLETQEAESRTNGMRDSARVLASVDGGRTWELVATNNSLRSDPGTENAELPVTATASSGITNYTNQKVQELFDSGAWRQARIDLGEFAGFADVRLRFDFSTAGEMDTSQVWRTSKPVLVDAIASNTVTFGDVSDLLTGLVMVDGAGLPLGAVTGIDAATGIVTLDTPVTLTLDTVVTFVDASGLNLLNNVPIPGFSPIQALGNSTGNFNSPQRGQNNAFGGFMVDDVIVGFAERGEMVTLAEPDQTDFFDTETEGAAAQVLLGSYQLEIRRGTDYVTPTEPPLIYQLFNTNDPLIAAAGTGTEYGARFGDMNTPRQQGQFIVESNILSDAAQYGISITAGERDVDTNAPHPGVARNLPVLNNAGLAAGAVVTNNVVASSGIAGIRVAGDPNTGNVPRGVVPFARLVNNTIYGGSTSTGTGVDVSQNAGPTIINNLFANLATGVAVDGSSRFDSQGRQRTVVATSAYWNTTTQVSGASQSIPIPLSANPFVNAGARNFYLVPGSQAIDSSLNSLQDREEFRVVNASVGINGNTLTSPDGASPILAPDRDLYGQLRSDDPAQASFPGLGLNVFKDIGAIDRVDTTQPFAMLVVPLDGGPSDTNPTPNVVFLNRQDARGLTRFEIQLSDNGVGIDKSTVVPEAFVLTHNGVPLVEGVDYVFRYLESSNRVVLESASVYALGGYLIRAIPRQSAPGVPGHLTDLANNVLLGSPSISSEKRFFIRLEDVPGVPTGVTGSPLENAVALQWLAPASSGSSPITDYVIQYTSNGGATWTTFPHAASTATSITVTGLVNGTGYRFRVAAVNAVGQGAYSDLSPVITPAALPPGPPTNVVGVRGDALVNVTWDPPANPGTAPVWDYWIQYSSNGGTTWTTFFDGIRGATAATVTGLTNGTAYLFRVAAVNKNGPSPWVATSVPVTPLARASAPTITSLTAGTNLLNVSWTTPNGNGSTITGYIVEYNNGTTTVQVPVGVVNTRQITGLVNGASYTVRVAAVTAAGTGIFSAWAGPVSPAGPASAPTGVTLMARDKAVDVSWVAPTDNGGRAITDYVVRYRLASSAVWSTVNVGSATTSRTISGLTNGQQYVFQVAAITSFGTGTFSAIAGPVTPQPLASPPTRLGGNAVGPGLVSLVWTAPSNTGGLTITDYIVQYSSNNGVSWTTTPDGVSTLARSTVSVPTGGTYVFRVAAITGGVVGQWSLNSLPVSA
jgi:hypothetical protein